MRSKAFGFFKRRRAGRGTSIRTRVLAIVLIPSAGLLVIGASVAGILVADGISAKNWATTLQQAVQPGIDFATVTSRERRLSQLALGGNAQAAADLRAQRQNTDSTMSSVAAVGAVMQKLNPKTLAEAMAGFTQLFAQLPTMRQQVDQLQVTPLQIDDYYTQLTQLQVTALHSYLATAPDPETAADEFTALELFQVVDASDRANSLAAGALTRGKPDDAEQFRVAQLYGTYRSQLDTLVPRLTPDERASYNALINSDAWKTVTAVETQFAQRGTIPVDMATWQNAATQVNSQLLGIWSHHFHYAEEVAESTAGDSLLKSSLGGAAVLVIAIGAFLIAVRLANTLVGRLRRLRERTLDLAERELPSLVKRLHDGERVDVEAEATPLDQGSDEIGQVAEAFNKAQHTAISAAAAEAKTRNGINRVYLDIAHRSQVVVHRQLELLDVAEAKQSDPEHLELLFQLDHLTTHARRNAENLVILGGGQPGRKWRNPVALEEIVRSAISETEEFARVSAVRLPEVSVLGAVVADLIHLLAELVDNATSFSPPDSPVTVRGNVVGKGVVVEVEDQGLGIAAEERDRLNERLRTPPDFEEMTAAGQRHLGMFVIGTLASRHGISVTLLESAYGGIKAIVLIPSKLIMSEPDPQPQQQAVEPEPVEVPAGVAAPRAARRREPDFESRVAPRERLWPTEDPPVEVMPIPHARHSEASMPGLPTPPNGGSNGRSSRPPLPRRRRQANLAPQLKADAAPAPEATSNEPRRARSPEQARNSMASFQRGTRHGRTTRPNSIDGDGRSTT